MGIDLVASDLTDVHVEHCATGALKVSITFIHLSFMATFQERCVHVIVVGSEYGSPPIEYVLSISRQIIYAENCCS